MNDTSFEQQQLLDALKLAESAMMNARLEAGKIDDLNGDRLKGTVKRVYPCNQAVVHATQDALDAIRALLS